MLIKRHLIHQPALMLVWMVCRSFLPLPLLPSLPYSFRSSLPLSLNYPCIHPCIHLSMHSSMHLFIHPPMHSSIQFWVSCSLVLGAHSYLLFRCHALQAVQEIPALLKGYWCGLGQRLGGWSGFPAGVLGIPAFYAHSLLLSHLPLRGSQFLACILSFLSD